MIHAANIVDALGGTVKVAVALDLTPSTVSSWKASGNIPRWRMRDIKALAKKNGVDLKEIPPSYDAAPRTGARKDAQKDNTQSNKPKGVAA